MTIHTTAGALDREDLDSKVTVELPGNSNRKGKLNSIDHGADGMTRLEIDRRHVVVNRSTNVTID